MSYCDNYQEVEVEHAGTWQGSVNYSSNLEQNLTDFLTELCERKT